MNNKTKIISGIFGSLVSISGLSLTSEELANIVSIICAVAGIIWTIITTGIIPLIAWYKKAKADNKITKEELEEAKTIVEETFDTLKEQTKKEEKK